jgi:hypothetical protein
MYKKILLVFVSIIAIQTAKAQTEKGSQSLGLRFGVGTQSSNLRSFNYSTNAYDPNVHGKSTSYSIEPTYSYFIADNLDLGLSVGYSSNTQKYDTEMPSYLREQKSNSFFTSVYLRKYFLYDNKIGIRTGPRFIYQKSKSSTLYDEGQKYNYDYNSYTGGVGLDFVYFPLKKLGLMAGLGGADYTHQTNTGESKGTSNQFSLNFANSLILSVNYMF